MERYTSLAKLYDALTSDYDYTQWVECALSLYGRYYPGGYNATRVLDLGCGTGRASLEFARRGCVVTGVDGSAEMLAMAEQRLESLNPRPLLVCQDMHSIDLGAERFNLVVALCDTFNYLNSNMELEQVFSRVARFLLPGGVLLFDLNTENKLANVYGDNTYIDEGPGFFIGWENNWQPRKRICTMELNIFTPVGANWRRTTEVHVERAHNQTEIERALVQSNFTNIIGPFAAFGLDEPCVDTERVFYAAQINTAS